MPGLRVHTYIDKLLFGKSYWKIHREMDKAFKALRRRHRVLFHDPLSAINIALKKYPHDPNAVLAAIYHINIDEQCTRNPEFREYLEALARLDRRRGKRRRRRSGLTFWRL